jgi:hypothetical protein
VEAQEKKITSNWGGVLDAALEIGRQRLDILQRMKAAFDRGDETEALRLGKELCGLES